MFRESGTSATFKSRTRNYEGTICASVRCRTYTRKSSERDARILRFQERTALLLPDLHPAHARLYTRGQQWLVGVLIFAGATLIPLGLTLLSSDLLFIFGAAGFLLAGSWVIRFVYVKIPHTSPLEIRSSE